MMLILPNEYRLIHLLYYPREKSQELTGDWRGILTQTHTVLKRLVQVK